MAPRRGLPTPHLQIHFSYTRRPMLMVRQQALPHSLVERGCPGLSITAAYDLVGWHSTGLAGVELSDCFVPDEAQFARPGEGFKQRATAERSA